MKITRLIAASTLALAMALPATAGEASWPDLKHALFGEQFLTPAGDIVEIVAPYRTTDDGRTHLLGHVTVPAGKMIESVMVVLDENPMPVSAVFDFTDGVPQFSFDVTMRINGPTPMHVIAKTTEGQLFVSEAFVKTSGTGACAAPPGTDPEEALATLGNMQLDISDPKPKLSLAGLSSTSTTPDKDLNISISHPSHSGLQMDQISLLFIHARFIDTIEVDVNGRDFMEITGSISLSENPDIKVSVPGYAQNLDVTLTDTDGSVSNSKVSVAGL